MKKAIVMKPTIKRFTENIGRKKTAEIILRHCNNISYSTKNKHVNIFVDNVKPLHELLQPQHDAHIKKAVDDIYGEQCTYDIKRSKSNVKHERSSHVMRYGSSDDVKKT